MVVFRDPPPDYLAISQANTPRALSWSRGTFQLDGPQHKFAPSGCRTGRKTVSEAGATWRLPVRSRQAQTLPHTNFRSPAYYDALSTRVLFPPSSRKQRSGFIRFYYRHPFKLLKGRFFSPRTSFLGVKTRLYQSLNWWSHNLKETWISVWAWFYVPHTTSNPHD